MANTTKPIIDANALEAMAKERPNEKFLKGSGVLKLIQAIRDLERANRQLRTQQPTPSTASAFQQRVQPWLLECFGAEIAADRVERNHRFLEESLELVQALGCTASEAHQLVDYVFGRPVGDPPQEVGGVMVTLAALCLASGLDMHGAGEVELARISVPELVAKIRAKQAAKPKHSPLPQSVAHQADSALVDAALPMQPICIASDGVIRFKQNRMVNDVYEFSQKRGLGLNEMAHGDYTQEERMQFAQLIGYSVSGYGGLSYASHESTEKADAVSDALIAASKQGGA